MRFSVNVERFEGPNHIDRIEVGEYEDVREEKKKKLKSDVKLRHTDSELPPADERMESMS